MGRVAITDDIKYVGDNNHIKSSYYGSKQEIKDLEVLLRKYGYRLGTKEENYRITKY